MPLIDKLSRSSNEHLFLPTNSQWIANSIDQENDVATIHKLFEPDWLLSENLVFNTASGRGLVYFFKAFGDNCVLRHYYRGGLIAKLSNDKFFFQKLEKSRPFQELSLLASLHNAGLNVPKPLAARLIQNNFSYTADIITAAIPRAHELHKRLLHQALDQQTWMKIGGILRKMHDLDACHYDINVKNVLLQEPNKELNKEQDSNADNQNFDIFLLDFDACKLRQGESWKRDNLNRFKRSLEKQSSKHASYYYNETNWRWLKEGYSASQNMPNLKH